MTTHNYASYSLEADNSIRHWLARGAATTPLKDLDQVIKPDGSPFGKGGRWAITNAPDSLVLKARVYAALPQNTWIPEAQPAHLDETPLGHWVYRRADADQVIDFSLFNFTPTYMQSWVFTCLEVDQPLTVPAELITIGAAHVWLNGQRIMHYKDKFSYVEPLFIPLTLTLNKGFNDVYLHGEMIGWREARLALGLRFPDHPVIQVRLPIGDVSPRAWHTAEEGLDQLQVKQFAFPSASAPVSLASTAPTPFAFEAEIEMPIPERVFEGLNAIITPRGKTLLKLKPGEAGELPISDALREAMASLPGENHLDLHLRPADGTPITSTRSIWASRNTFTQQPYGTYDSRILEAREHIAQMPFDVLGTMCAVATGKSEHIDADAVALACHFMENRNDCADFYAVSLMALIFMYGDSPALKPAERERIEEAFRGFKFWIDEPGIDAMCYFTENHQILFHVTAYLAGQYWREWTFTNSDQTGKWQQKRAQPRIESWILRRLRGNFSEWDSNAYMALDAFALLVLVEYAESRRIRKMATALLDKIFFLIACQSFKGAHGSTHGRCYVSGLKSSRFENTSSLQRIAWGMGIFNGETRTTGMLALAAKYRVPDVIQRIGAHLPDTLTTWARSSAEYRPYFDLKRGSWDARTITHRTPDYMLSACVDHRPGDVGIQEHLWQATFSPEAVVFTTYPGNSQEHGNARPNFWAGSVRLPRVAMYGRTVICSYQLRDNVGLGFSHAYFPTAHFDETLIDGQWAFARCGEGYIALWSDGALALTESGQHAGQELRSSAKGNVWVCSVGRKAEDGDFSAFVAKVKKSAPQMDRLSVKCADVDGMLLSLGWDGDFLIDGVRQTWENFPHYENSYTQTSMRDDHMTIAHDGLSLTLDLKRGKRL